jgi:hypothetical protein
VDVAQDVGVESGNPYGISAAANRRINAATSEVGDQDNFNDSTNVQRVEKLMG